MQVGEFDYCMAAVAGLRMALQDRSWVGSGSADDHQSVSVVVSFAPVRVRPKGNAGSAVQVKTFAVALGRASADLESV
jgi:hypothetical protein